MIEPLNSRITAPNYFLSNLHTGKEQRLVTIDRLLYMYISIVFTTMVYIVSELDGRLSFNIEAVAIYTSYPAQR